MITGARAKQLTNVVFEIRPIRYAGLNRVRDIQLGVETAGAFRHDQSKATLPCTEPNVTGAFGNGRQQTPILLEFGFVDHSAVIWNWVYIAPMMVWRGAPRSGTLGTPPA